MTDVANIVLGLPGLFVSCVQCLEVVQYGRAFEDDQKELHLHLEILELRLVRWGHCVGILDNDSKFITGEVGEKLKPHLQNILAQFNEAKQMLGERAPEKLLDKDQKSTRATVRNAVRQWTIKYTEKCHEGMAKIQWAICDKRTLEAIMCNIRLYMEYMMNVFPPDEKEKFLVAERILQEEDIKDLNPPELNMLKDLAKDDDDVIVQVVKQAIEKRGASAHVYGGKWTIKGEDKDFDHRNGDDIARGVAGMGHNYTGNYEIGGTGKSSFGNNYH